MSLTQVSLSQSNEHMYMYSQQMSIIQWLPAVKALGWAARARDEPADPVAHMRTRPIFRSGWNFRCSCPLSFQKRSRWLYLRCQWQACAEWCATRPAAARYWRMSVFVETVVSLMCLRDCYATDKKMLG